MRARLMLLWTLIIVAALALPGAVLADGYHVKVTTNSCAATGHTATLAFNAVSDAGASADDATVAFTGQIRRNGTWHNLWAVAWVEELEPNSTMTQTFPGYDHITNARHRVRLKATVNFRQSGLVAWTWHFTSRAC